MFDEIIKFVYSKEQTYIIAKKKVDDKDKYFVLVPRVDAPSIELTNNVEYARDRDDNVVMSCNDWSKGKLTFKWNNNQNNYVLFEMTDIDTIIEDYVKRTSKGE